MNAIEKRARALLAKEHRQDQRRAKGIRIGHKSVSRDDHLAVRAIIAALTPPEGYVLVPVVLTEPMLDVMWRAEGDMKDSDMQSLWAELITARPEVSNVND